jgi:hypothetical protein
VELGNRGLNLLGLVGGCISFVYLDVVLMNTFNEVACRNLWYRNYFSGMEDNNLERCGRQDYSLVQPTHAAN